MKRQINKHTCDFREIAVLDTVQHTGTAYPGGDLRYLDGYDILPERRIVVVDMGAFLIASPDKIRLPGQKYYDCVRMRFNKGPADEQLLVDIEEAERILGTIPRKEKR